MCDSLTGVAISGAVSMVLLVFSMSSISTVGPTEYGVLFNRVTGSVYHNYPKGPGLYFITPILGFYHFPAYNRTLELSAKSYADGPPIECRTGPDENDPDSGGQPVTLHLSFVYRIRKQDISKIYQSFALVYEQRLVMFARQSVSDIVQHFDPTLFWQNREKATAEMEKALKHDLWKDGFVEVHSLQLLRAEFNPKYEATIIGIQLATQSRTTSQYRQQVVRVLKEIDIIAAQSNATVTKIGADAEAKAKVLTNNATMLGFTLTQEAKALGYRMFYEKLGWRQPEVLKYIQIQSIAQHKGDHLTVGIKNGGK
mmetsp:Transcript_16225/g.31712  ORF Transcript_16225/g.31712 Transcript_16225/m.31712 type:complete len:312 (+) Transcript_16225:66-1001(+)|eukprot:CAMPEP_0167792596 /NCGR_PEP_ID=MMETSP0111_2-20121227/12648_1 /TAXON_ID=91324 /ORGANISM="Lotharella globosa, Strain CCCM811" /LENGTH=311 /DNA_ID=CAMNT_0007685531 /DNA_START=24 /DNA_END=959 /DNA_ORIENTATION=-